MEGSKAYENHQVSKRETCSPSLVFSRQVMGEPAQRESQSQRQRPMMAPPPCGDTEEVGWQEPPQGSH